MTKPTGTGRPKRPNMLSCELPPKMLRDLRALSKRDGRAIRWHVENAVGGYLATTKETSQ
jgi:hypothetical protein